MTMKDRPAMMISERRLPCRTPVLARIRNDHVLEHMVMHGSSHVVKRTNVAIERRNDKHVSYLPEISCELNIR